MRLTMLVWIDIHIRRTVCMIRERIYYVCTPASQPSSQPASNSETHSVPVCTLYTIQMCALKNDDVVWVSQLFGGLIWFGFFVVVVFGFWFQYKSAHTHTTAQVLCDIRHSLFDMTAFIWLHTHFMSSQKYPKIYQAEPVSIKPVHADYFADFIPTFSPLKIPHQHVKMIDHKCLLI